GKPFMKNHQISPTSTRRDFMKSLGGVAAASALTGASIPHVFGQEGSGLNLALVGCGGRGTGAAADALSVTNLPTKLVAMADVFPHRLASSYNGLANRYANQPE